MTSSKTLFQRAQQHIPGGVNSPVRAFNGVGGTPVFFDRGVGAHLFDVEGKRYIDYVASWGPLILGHAQPEILGSVIEMAHKGLSFGAPTEVEIDLADKVNELMPSLEMVRMVNSGTEATMTALRLARGFTGRDKIIKFEGCYHGHSDCLLVKAGSGCLTLGVPSSPGVPASITEHTLTASFNDLSSVAEIFQQFPNDIAAIIVEPIAGNMGCVPATQDFLQGLRDLCDHHRSVLIFDEVITGFRVGLHGAQHHYGIKPDLTCLGKIIGGGMPVGAFGGARAIMEHIAPSGPVYQAGTLSGNPIAMTAGLTTLNLLSKDGVYENLQEKTNVLTDGIRARAQAAGIPLVINQVGSMFSLFFNELSSVNNFSDVMQSNVDRFQCFYHAILQEGINFGPSAYESAFVSTTHSEEDLQNTLDVFEKVFSQTLK